MARVDYQRKIRSKHFYRAAYKRALTLLIFSMLIMLILSVSTGYVYTQRNRPDYYATNSAGFITKLVPLNAPNRRSTALLQPDPPEEGGIKVLNIE